jgi:hypothetical protein
MSIFNRIGCDGRGADRPGRQRRHRDQVKRPVASGIAFVSGAIFLDVVFAIIILITLDR